jgi:hypothetical protein
MLKRLLAITALLLTFVASSTGQDLKSGPQADEVLPGSFQPLNINGTYAGRNHCLVCENRLNPVALVFVKAQAEGVDPEVKKLLEALDKVADEHFLYTGMASFVVFLTPDANTGATEEPGGDPVKIIPKTVKHEKLVASLTEFAKPFKRLIVTCYPTENVATKYKLADKAEVTVVEYARLRVFSSFGFTEGKLKQEGIDKVLEGVDSMLDRLKKGEELKKGDKEK